MATEKKDDWSSEAYQHSASFVPKLAGKIVQWLDPQPGDVILDIGCGDGVLDLQLSRAVGDDGRVHGVDSSAAMIDAAREAAGAAGLANCTFEVLDANELVNKPELQAGQFSKAFSNAAMHWILRPEDTREQFFRGVRAALAPGGVFAFEMGGLGNVAEVMTGIVSGVARRLGGEKTGGGSGSGSGSIITSEGLARAREVNPWFYPDEAWMRDMLVNRVGGWEVERIEREWRPTPVDRGGVDGWVRLMGRRFLDAVPEAEREACTREIVAVLQETTAAPDGGNILNYVRLRVVARKV